MSGIKNIINQKIKLKTIAIDRRQLAIPFIKIAGEMSGIMHRDKNTGNDYIKGIVCDVKNCVYNEPDRKCYAKKIEVGPNFAVSSADTICATFKSK